jgi:peptidoglycan/xylan/chitin deacetylase (PgdA/CDA1 family)
VAVIAIGAVASATSGAHPHTLAAARASQAPQALGSPSPSLTPPATPPTGPSTTPAPPPTASPPTRPHRPPTRLRYRITGCRSRGGLYLHGPRRREVAIGFDDGPAPVTPAFVQMLERAHVRATFFLIGALVTGASRATLLRELADGDVLGDHTFTHPNLLRSGSAGGQLLATRQAIRHQTGYTPCLFRPPYGAYDSATVHAARSLGLATVLWDVDPTDWARPGTAAIEQRVLNQVRPGSIILSHDGGGPRNQTLAAYPSIIRRLRARGYRIVTIPELLGFRPTYVPCVRLCEGIGVLRRALPHDALIERAR